MKTNCKLQLLMIFFFLFLGFSNHVISVAAVPSTRTLNLDAKSSISQEIKKNNNMDVVRRMMDIETNDYPAPGASRRHDPPPVLGRMMDIETNDYPAPGASRRHDPPPVLRRMMDIETNDYPAPGASRRHHPPPVSVSGGGGGTP